MRGDIPKCEKCVWLKSEFSSSLKYGISWETLQCAKHNNYHPFTARSHGGLCGDIGRDYRGKNSMDYFVEFLALTKD